MTTSGSSVGPSSHARVSGIFALIELGLGAAAVSTWVALELVDVRVGLGLAAARTLAWFLYLRRLLAPIQRVEQRGEASTDAELTAADASIQRVHKDTPLVYAASWTALELSWVILGAYGVGVEYGQPEIYAGSMFACCLLSLTALIFLVIERALDETCVVIGELLLARRLRPWRRPTSIARPLARSATWMALGILTAVAATAIVWMAQVVRGETQARLQAQVEQIAIGLGPALDRELELEFEVVRADALEPRLRARLDSSEPEAEPGRSIAARDRQAGRVLAAAPIGDGRWVMASAAPDVPLRRFALFIVLASLVIVPVFSLAFRAIARAISAPLAAFAEAAQGFVDAGELAALEQLSSLRNDEIGRLAVSFNAMLGILFELSEAAQAVSAGDLRVVVDHPGALHDAFRGMFARLNSIVASLRETSVELASAATELQALTERQEQTAQIQSANLQRLTEHLGALAISAQEVNVATEGVRQDADRAVDTTEASAVAIAELREQSASIAELLRVIEEIAQRSDLLALNGSLEATRAGEAGRGFALVAAEMRRLSERIVGTVEDVRAQVAGIEAVGQRTVDATDHSRELARRTAVAAGRISTLIGTQSVATEQASRGLVVAASEVENATAAMTQVRASAVRLGELAGELERSIARFELRERRGDVKLVN